MVQSCFVKKVSLKISQNSPVLESLLNKAAGIHQVFNLKYQQIRILESPIFQFRFTSGATVSIE